MKIVSYPDHRCTVAIGSFSTKSFCGDTDLMYSRKIKASTVCHPDDTYDEKLGVEIAKRKYAIKERRVKRDYHESQMREYMAKAERYKHLVEEEKKIISNHDVKIAEMQSNLEKFIGDSLCCSDPSQS